MVGSQGGAPADAHWVHNLRANPVARVQDGSELRELAVRELTGDERQMCWGRATEVWPDYDSYQAATERTIPVFSLEPRN